MSIERLKDGRYRMRYYANGTKSSNEIFIHGGSNASWSDGCIVANRGEVLKIWNTIHPKENANVLVKVIDEDAGA